MQGLSIRRPRNNLNTPPVLVRNNAPLNNNNNEENVWEVNLGNYRVPIGNSVEYGSGSLSWADKPVSLLSPILIPNNASSTYKNSPRSTLSPIARNSNASALNINSPFYEPPTQKRKLSRKSRKSRKSSRRANRKVATRRNTRK
jgi:hypothetical protein